MVDIYFELEDMITRQQLPANRGLKARFVVATKPLIELLQVMNTHNRQTKQRHVQFLAKEIIAGRWQPTNQGIGVTDTGIIIDGGHRLEAIRLAGYPPVKLLIVTGLPMEAQKFVDQHAKRSMTDTLKLFLNRDVSSRIVAAMNVIHKDATGWNSGAQRMGPDETADMLDVYHESINAIMGICRISKMLSSPILAALIKRHHETKSERIIRLATDIVNGELLTKGSPALTFRTWMLSDKKRAGGGEVQKERFAKTISAIRAELDGRKITRLCTARDW
ncbi:MAG: hypothetical protein M0P69_16925 [Bacteroidales bacterium]|nr:hypothetical protein [Bacteroidales bacterium]